MADVPLPFPKTEREPVETPTALQELEARWAEKAASEVLGPFLEAWIQEAGERRGSELMKECLRDVAARFVLVRHAALKDAERRGVEARRFDEKFLAPMLKQLDDEREECERAKAAKLKGVRASREQTLREELCHGLARPNVNANPTCPACKGTGRAPDGSYAAACACTVPPERDSGHAPRPCLDLGSLRGARVVGLGEEVWPATTTIDGVTIEVFEGRSTLRLDMKTVGGTGEWRCRCPSDPTFDKSWNPRYVKACSACGATRPEPAK